MKNFTDKLDDLTNFWDCYFSQPQEIYPKSKCIYIVDKYKEGFKEQYYILKDDMIKKTAFDGKILNGLYNVFQWTMFSPYVWDPYGLQPKLYELVNSIFKADFLVEYHKKIICESYSEESDIVLKEYLQCIYSALALDWMLRNNRFYPMHIQSLMIDLPAKLKEKILSLIQYGKQRSRTVITESSDLPYQYCHDNLKCSHVKEIDDYIRTMLEIVVAKTPKANDELDNTLNDIYKIIRNSINENRIC